MNNDSFPDTFVVCMQFTPALILDLIESKDEHRESQAFVDAVDTEIKSRFGTEHSYELVRKTHKIVKAEAAQNDPHGYMCISFERR